MPDSRSGIGARDLLLLLLLPESGFEPGLVPSKKGEVQMTRGAQRGRLRRDRVAQTAKALHTVPSSATSSAASKAAPSSPRRRFASPLDGTPRTQSAEVARSAKPWDGPYQLISTKVRGSGSARPVRNRPEPPRTDDCA
jgi:hypothetical protein